METQIIFRDPNATRNEHELRLIDRFDANALMDFIEKNVPARAFAYIQAAHHFMTRHAVEVDGEVDKDIYVVDAKQFYKTIEQARFFVTSDIWKNAPVVKELAI